MPCCRADSMAQNRKVNPKTFFGELKRRNVYASYPVFWSIPTMILSRRPARFVK